MFRNLMNMTNKIGKMLFIFQLNLIYYNFNRNNENNNDQVRVKFDKVLYLYNQRYFR